MQTGYEKVRFSTNISLYRPA